jgi:hypothetical protein
MRLRLRLRLLRSCRNAWQLPLPLFVCATASPGLRWP